MGQWILYLWSAEGATERKDIEEYKLFTVSPLGILDGGVYELVGKKDNERRH